jgi:hypothetical protein
MNSETVSHFLLYFLKAIFEVKYVTSNYSILVKCCNTPSCTRAHTRTHTHTHIMPQVNVNRKMLLPHETQTET